MDPAVNGAVDPRISQATRADGDGDGDIHIHVLVTAFGLFASAADVNPSWEIARTLPTELTLPSGTPDPLAPSATASLAPTPSVKIHLTVPPDPVPVTYTGVRSFIAATYDPAPYRFDVVLHLGVAAPRTFYTLEKRAHRDGYAMPGADGALEDPAQRPAYWASCPKVMETRIDCEAVVKQVREDVAFAAEDEGGDARGPRVDEESGETDGKRARPDQIEVNMEMTGTGIFVGTNAGYYLCDYIFYSSLAYYDALARRRLEAAIKDGRPERLGGRGDRPPLVDFLHVPQGHDERALAKGREVVVAALEAIVRDEVLTEKGYPFKGSVVM